MRHLWQVLFLIGLAIPARASAECADVEALDALDAARNARGIVTDLGLMRAWHGHLTREIDHLILEYGTMLDPEEVGVRHATSWHYWSDSFEGFRLCATDTPVDLDRQWWGANAKYDDLDTGLGYELFFLAATDELGFSGDLKDVDYGWRHRIAGAELRYKDWVAVRAGTIDIKKPKRSGEPEHEGSAYVAFGIPKFGIFADLLVHPGSRRLDMLMLGMRRVPIGWGGIRVSGHGGWLEGEQKGIGGISVSAIDEAVVVSSVFEGAPVRLRSVAMRLETPYRSHLGDDFWLHAGFSPFLEVSAFNSAVFEQATGRSLVPGAATGLSAHITMGPLSAGLEGFVGVNRAEELSRLSAVADHVHWGGRVYVRMGI